MIFSNVVLFIVEIGWLCCGLVYCFDDNFMVFLCVVVYCYRCFLFGVLCVCIFYFVFVVFYIFNGIYISVSIIVVWYRIIWIMIYGVGFGMNFFINDKFYGGICLF